MDELLKRCDDWMCKHEGYSAWDMENYCYSNGYFDCDIVYEDGLIVDAVPYIPRRSLQAACDELGIKVDCIGF